MGFWHQIPIPSRSKPMLLAVLAIISLVTGIITMGTGIAWGKEGGVDVGFVIGMSIMTGLFCIFIAIPAIVGGILRKFPPVMGLASFVLTIIGFLFTWQAVGVGGLAASGGGISPLGGAFLAFAVLTGIIQIAFLFFSVETHVFEDEEGDERPEKQRKQKHAEEHEGVHD